MNRRDQALLLIKHLYGLRHDFIEDIVRELGYDALSDRALERLAQIESDHELKHRAELKRREGAA